MRAGWYILIGVDPNMAHFVFVGGGDGEARKACTMKGVNVPTLTAWSVAQDIGKIPFCEHCKRYLNPPPAKTKKAA